MRWPLRQMAPVQRCIADNNAAGSPQRKIDQYLADFARVQGRKQPQCILVAVLADAVLDAGKKLPVGAFRDVGTDVVTPIGVSMLLGHEGFRAPLR